MVPLGATPTCRKRKFTMSTATPHCLPPDLHGEQHGSLGMLRRRRWLSLGALWRNITLPREEALGTNRNGTACFGATRLGTEAQGGANTCTTSLANRGGDPTRQEVTDPASRATRSCFEVPLTRPNPSLTLFEGREARQDPAWRLATHTPCPHGRSGQRTVHKPNPQTVTQKCAVCALCVHRQGESRGRSIDVSGWGLSVYTGLRPCHRKGQGVVSRRSLDPAAIRELPAR